MNQVAMEGQLLAHRRILQLIVGELAGTAAAERIEDLLRERSMLQDGQEDPGAVETAGMGLELAVAEEFRRVVDGIAKRRPGEAHTVRPVGP
jgi:hypothetical protein